MNTILLQHYWNQNSYLYAFGINKAISICFNIEIDVLFILCNNDREVHLPKELKMHFFEKFLKF